MKADCRPKVFMSGVGASGRTVSLQPMQAASPLEGLVAITGITSCELLVLGCEGVALKHKEGEGFGGLCVGNHVVVELRGFFDGGHQWVPLEKLHACSGDVLFNITVKEGRVVSSTQVHDRKC